MTESEHPPPGGEQRSFTWNCDLTCDGTACECPCHPSDSDDPKAGG